MRLSGASRKDVCRTFKRAPSGEVDPAGQRPATVKTAIHLNAVRRAPRIELDRVERSVLAQITPHLRADTERYWGKLMVKPVCPDRTEQITLPPSLLTLGVKRPGVDWGEVYFNNIR